MAAHVCPPNTERTAGLAAGPHSPCNAAQPSLNRHAQLRGTKRRPRARMVRAGRWTMEPKRSVADGDAERAGRGVHAAAEAWSRDLGEQCRDGVGAFHGREVAAVLDGDRVCAGDELGVG